MKRLYLVFTLAASLHAATVYTAYTVTPQLGNQNFGGSLGSEFDVNSAITITALGVFDSGANGIAAGTFLAVTIFDRNTQLALTPDQMFWDVSPGTLIGGSRFKDLLTPLTLGPGNYSVVAWGYNPSEPGGNLGCNTGGNPGSICNNGNGNVTPSILDTGAGAISFVGGGDFNVNPGVYADHAEPGPVNRHNAGTFQFTLADTPEPATFILIGAGLVAASVLRRRSARS